jgi:hypothetical protein
MHTGICILCEFPSIADTTFGILEQYFFLLPPDWDGWPLNFTIANQFFSLIDMKRKFINSDNHKFHQYQ